jgi:hypothetical protein
LPLIDPPAFPATGGSVFAFPPNRYRVKVRAFGTDANPLGWLLPVGMLASRPDLLDKPRG